MMINKIEIIQLQDCITKQKVDCIVNAANQRLESGGGVCGAIFKSAGPELIEACKEIGDCSPGRAVVTPSFNLHTCKYIIHAVGPTYHDESQLERLGIFNAVLADFSPTPASLWPWLIQ